MSRCVHEQSNFRLRQLPKCSKCKLEMQLVMVIYESEKQPVWEWECRSCSGKAVAKNKLKEAEPSEFEQLLHERCQNDHRQKQKRKQKSKCRK